MTHEISTYSTYPNGDYPEVREDYMLCVVCRKEVCCDVDDDQGGMYVELWKDGEAFKKEECPGAPGCEAEEAEDVE